MTKYTFSAVFSEVWIQAMSVRNIISSFRTTGVYPPDRNVIKLPDEVMPNLAKKTCLAYIPLYTHMKRRVSGLCYANLSEEEQEDFERCYEEGIIPDNPR